MKWENEAKEGQSVWGEASKEGRKKEKAPLIWRDKPPHTHTHSLFASLVMYGLGICFGRLQLSLGCRKLFLFRIDLQERGNKVTERRVINGGEKCGSEGVKKKKKKKVLGFKS